jgi:hypothetical protein
MPNFPWKTGYYNFSKKQDLSQILPLVSKKSAENLPAHRLFPIFAISSQIVG